MKPRFFLIGAAIAVIAVATGAAYANISAHKFVQKASMANLFEIESSKLALSKSQNPNIKNFAKMMLEDHSKTGDKLKQVLASENSPEKPATELDSKHQQLMDKLNSASGSAFDSQYVSLQTDAHKKAVRLFSKYAKHGKDAVLKDFAAQTLPALEGHLEHVEQLQASQ